MSARGRLRAAFLPSIATATVHGVPTGIDGGPHAG